MLPIPEAMEPEVLNQAWLKMAAESMAGLYIELEAAAHAVENAYVLQLSSRVLMHRLIL
jgi:hypothetical protein